MPPPSPQPPDEPPYADEILLSRDEVAPLRGLHLTDQPPDRKKLFREWLIVTSILLALTLIVALVYFFIASDWHWLGAWACAGTGLLLLLATAVLPAVVTRVTRDMAEQAWQHRLLIEQFEREGVSAALADRAAEAFYHGALGSAGQRHIHLTCFLVLVARLPVPECENIREQFLGAVLDEITKPSEPTLTQLFRGFALPAAFTHRLIHDAAFRGCWLGLLVKHDACSGCRGVAIREHRKKLEKIHLDAMIAGYTGMAHGSDTVGHQLGSELMKAANRVRESTETLLAERRVCGNCEHFLCGLCTEAKDGNPPLCPKCASPLQLLHPSGS